MPERERGVVSWPSGLGQLFFNFEGDVSKIHAIVRVGTVSRMSQFNAEVLKDHLKPNDSYAWLSEFYPYGRAPKESEMGKGHGGKLLDGILSTLKEQGHKHVYVHTPKERLQALLRKRGFKEIQPQHFLMEL